MSDSPFTEAEPALQLRLRKQRIFPVLTLLVAVLFGRWLIAQTPDRLKLGERVAAVHFDPVHLDAREFSPLRLAGAWDVSVDDPRFGGLSTLAIDGEQLLALTDAGVIVRLPRPGGNGRANLNELPDGPGDPGFKRYRDSEALLRAPDGSGWWVAFENRHSLWRYDASFFRGQAREGLTGYGWGLNKGIEGIAATTDHLLLFPEAGSSVLAISEDGVRRELPLAGSGDHIAEAATLPDGRIILLLRQPTLRGFRNSLAWLRAKGSGYRIGRRVSLGVGALDNMEGMAAERTPTGTRLWLVSDNNFHSSQRTLLLALDLPPGG